MTRITDEEYEELLQLKAIQMTLAQNMQVMFQQQTATNMSMIQFWDGIGSKYSIDVKSTPYTINENREIVMVGLEKFKRENMLQ